jgi:hypothetical protein
MKDLYLESWVFSPSKYGITEIVIPSTQEAKTGGS